MEFSVLDWSQYLRYDNVYSKQWQHIIPVNTNMFALSSTHRPLGYWACVGRVEKKLPLYVSVYEIIDIKKKTKVFEIVSCKIYRASFAGQLLLRSILILLVSELKNRPQQRQIILLSPSIFFFLVSVLVSPSVKPERLCWATFHLIGSFVNCF